MTKEEKIAAAERVVRILIDNLRDNANDPGMPLLDGRTALTIVANSLDRALLEAATVAPPGGP